MGAKFYSGVPIDVRTVNKNKQAFKAETGFIFRDEPV